VQLDIADKQMHAAAHADRYESVCVEGSKETPLHGLVEQSKLARASSPDCSAIVLDLRLLDRRTHVAVHAVRAVRTMNGRRQRTPFAQESYCKGKILRHLNRAAVHNERVSTNKLFK